MKYRMDARLAFVVSGIRRMGEKAPEEERQKRTRKFPGPL
jgi:hypothetical protein